MKHHNPARIGIEARFGGKYLSLTSFKRDGTGVATPLWFVIDSGRLLVNTDAQSFKARRIRRNASVMIAPCTASGRVRGDLIAARAEQLPDSELEHVNELMARKYRVDRALILPLYRAAQWLRGNRRETVEIALAITPT
jgi:PPOX class probable F420-dependent enzyme